MTLQISTKYLHTPWVIFLIVLGVLFVGLLVADLLNPGANYTSLLVSEGALGNFFLAQSVAIFITTALVARRSNSRKVLKRWLTASIVSLALIVFGFLFFYIGPRITTEADGPATIQYYCVYKELYSTTGGNQPLCVLKNIPLAISNVVHVQHDFIAVPLPSLEQILSFAILETILATSLITKAKQTRRIVAA